MTCTKCGESVPSGAACCPFCGTKMPAAPPATAGVPSPPPGTAAGLEATAPPSPSPPLPPPGAPPPAEPRPAARPSPVLTVMLIGCAGLFVLAVAGGLLGWRWFASGRGQPPPADSKTGAFAGATEPSGASATPEEEPSASASGGATGLDEFVGTWEFVGEPGPWGEGCPFTLRRSGNIIIGEVEIEEMYDYRIHLQLAMGNGELMGESETQYKDGRSETNSVTMKLSASRNVMTVRFRSDDGSWISRAAEKKSGAVESAGADVPLDQPGAYGQP